MSETDQTIIALLKQKLDTFEKKIDFVILKVDELLTKEDASKIYATNLALEKVKSKQNFYAIIVPILTGIVGFLINKIL